MNRFLKASAIALLALLTLAPAASARGRVIVRGGFGFYGGPLFYAPGWYPYYGYGPYWGPFYSYPTTGTVKIVANSKDDLVYVDGGYVGVAAKSKKLSLRPGNHTVEVRDPSGHSLYQERVNVLRGRTVEVRARA